MLELTLIYYVHYPSSFFDHYLNTSKKTLNMNPYYTPYTCSKYLMSPNPKYKVNNILKNTPHLVLGLPPSFGSGQLHHSATTSDPVHYAFEPKAFSIEQYFHVLVSYHSPMLCFCQLTEVVECLHRLMVLNSSMFYLAPTY